MGFHTRVIEGKRHRWAVEELWRLSEGLLIAEAKPESLIDLDTDGWFQGKAPTAREVLGHMRRILNADLGHPVILAPDGRIMDGAHRVCKALLLGVPTIHCVRFTEFPPASGVEDE
jgi:hypothetical protein